MFMAIKIISYAAILYCLWIYISPIFVYVKMRKRRLKYQQHIKKDDSQKKTDAVFLHLEKILSILKNEVSTTTVYNFVALMIILFGTSFTLFYSWYEHFIYTLIVSLIIGIIPYIIARLMVVTVQLQTSLSLLLNFDVILANYQATKDIYYTFVYSIELIQDKHLKRVMKKLIVAMGLERDSEEFKKAEKIFVYSINSHYAKRFGMLILKGYLEKAEIEKALSQLGKDIHKRKQAIQTEKSQIIDTFFMGIIQPFILFGCFYLSYRAFPIPDYWTYFMDKSNLFYFTIATILSFLSVLTAIIVKRPKTDI